MLFPSKKFGNHFTAMLPRPMLLFVAALIVAGPISVSATNPVVDVWYGNAQQFGHIGNPQNWVNILGNATDPDGIQSLTFRLNGGASQNLSMGPDTRRLLEAGDFNVEIDFLQLLNGANTVEITATDTLANLTVVNVTLNYVDGQIWPFSYLADWSTASVISDVAQVVDGQWSLTVDGLRTDVMGYDRTFVVGDLGWSDYEIEVPITIHDIDPNGFIWPSVSPGIGFTNRWTGHTTLVLGEQPHAYWLPSGGGAWYNAGQTSLRLNGSTNGGLFLEDPNRVLTEDVEYIWKMRMQTQIDGTSFYAVKVWEQGQPEPGVWDFSGTDAATGLLNGSTIFIAHHVDATIGDVVVTDLVTDTDPPVITNVQSLHGQTSTLMRWNTDELATGNVEYGLTTGYELGTVNQTMSTINHSVLLESLIPGNNYFYRVNATDARNNSSSMVGSFMFTGTSGIMSDDFSAPALNTSIWTFVNPLSDSTLTMTGTQAEISMPNAEHDVWTGTDTVPRLRQAIADEDFEIEVKFESQPIQSFQGQGILVEEANNVALRFEFHQVNGSNKIFVARIVPTAQALLSQQITLTNPMYMRVGRNGDTWTMRYSSDGENWTDALTFVQEITASAISVYGGSENAANTVTIDYLFNVAAPISPEDGSVSIDAASLPAGTEDEVYPNQALAASGGTQPYNWSLFSGALPPGLTLGPNGVISGTPTAGSDTPYQFTVEVTDGLAATAQQTFSIQVDYPPLSLSATYPPGAGKVNQFFWWGGLAAAGGKPPYTYEMTGGWLPWPLAVNPDTGVIMGLPVNPETTYFTIQVTDDNGNTATHQSSIIIQSAGYVCGACHGGAGF